MSQTSLRSSPSLVEFGQLAREQYNATLTAIMPVHADLRIIRVVPDVGVPPLEAGQYLTLGLGNWEPRVASSDEEHISADQMHHLSKRAYSISCSLLDDVGRLRRVQDFPYLEFYVALIRHGVNRPPALTPRLFALEPGARLYVSPHPTGHYTLSGVDPGDHLFFFGTGTGEAPHNAMIAELLSRGHQGHILSSVSVRFRCDAAYLAVHTELMRRYPNYHYLLATTREPENLDPARPDFVGKRYLQDLVASGDVERVSGVPLDPATCHIYLCGNPAMIGAARHASSTNSAAMPGSMLDLLLQRGFSTDQPHKPGNVHFERYW